MWKNQDATKIILTWVCFLSAKVAGKVPTTVRAVLGQCIEDERRTIKSKILMIEVELRQ